MVMLRQTAQQPANTTQSDATLAPTPARGLGRGWAGELGHHRYYGSSACNGGEQIVETRRGRRARNVNLCGF
jgi:hypothetical protein